MSVFVHAQVMKTVHVGGRGVKKWQNSVQVNVECPLITFLRNIMTFPIYILNATISFVAIFFSDSLNWLELAVHTDD